MGGPGPRARPGGALTGRGRGLGALIFPGLELLDLFGPLEMFGMLPDNPVLHLVAEEAGSLPSGQGPAALADTALRDPGGFDVLLVPGGMGTRREIDHPRLIDWPGTQAEAADWVLTVCTGPALLAKTGRLDGRPATTNKRAFDWVAARRPEVHWQRRAQWTQDGRVFAASGVSAGMHMILAAIARMHDGEAADRVARLCQYRWNSDAAADPFAR